MSIEVKHLTHVYMPGSPFEVRALDDVNLTIKDGEFIGIIGHTGSGKSTLISHFNALEKSEPGHVFVNGMDLGDKDTKLTDVRRAVGLVFQYPEYQLFEETVEKDIAFGPRNLKLDEKEIKHRVTEAMLLVGLDDSLRKASPFNLSGGQKRRVAIAGVLAMNPSILVLDEPAAGLDPAGRRSMLELIRGIHQSGVTVVMVSHSMDDVGKYCDRLYVLDHGRIQYQGTPAEVFEHGNELKKIGLDVPECAKLAAVLREKGFDIAPGTFRREDMCREILKNLKK
ncbi:MAG: energy-coupling factor transporter ATPase [Eubacteriales bacterium]|nr:energy-coupling factor transporter ATPase [Eubacteriales bacterium]